MISLIFKGYLPRLIEPSGMPLGVLKAGMRRSASSLAFSRKRLSPERSYAEIRPPRMRITHSNSDRPAFCCIVTDKYDRKERKRKKYRKKGRKILFEREGKREIDIEGQ
jgi:hypothetical protein